MDELATFLGTWKSEPRYPMSNHTVTWSVGDDGRPEGRWRIEPHPDVRRPPAMPDVPAVLEFTIEAPHVEDGVLLFRVNRSPFLSEFRLSDAATAVVGAALAHLPPEHQTPERLRSIEGHRVRLVRQG